MKLAIALLLGVVSASDLKALRNKINNLRIEVSRDGQRKIEREAVNVHDVASEISETRVVRNLHRSLESWGESQEVQDLKALDQAFWESPEGLRLKREWMDVGEVLEENVVETENGIHINNDAMDDIGDELEDVGDEYHDLEGSDWDLAFQYQWDLAANNHAADRLKRRMDRFHNSDEGRDMQQAVANLDNAVHDNLEVNDVPDDWELNLIRKPKNNVAKATNMVHQNPFNHNSFVNMMGHTTNTKPKKVAKATNMVHQNPFNHNSFVNMMSHTTNTQPKKASKGFNKNTFKKTKRSLKHLNNMLHVTVHHPNEIADEYEDVVEVANAIQNEPEVQDVFEAFQNWGRSAEVRRLQRTDERFLATERGQRMQREWEDVFHALDEAVTVNTTLNENTGHWLDVHVNNDDMAVVEDELEDVGDQYDALENTHWDRRYTRAWKKALHNEEFRGFKRSVDRFSQSNFGPWFGSEVEDLVETVKDNVEVTDVPASWQRGQMFLF